MNSAYKIHKVSFFKRVIAFIIDISLVFFLSIIIENFVMTPIMNASYNYSGMMEEYNNKLVEYNIAKFDDKTGNIIYNDIKKDGEEWELFNKDKRAVEVQSKLSQLNLFKITMDTMISEFIFLCLIPLILKNGQTIGKKIMKMALVSTNEVKVKYWNVFARWAIGIYAFETMINLYFFSFFGLPLVMIISLITAIFSKKGMALHDYIGGTIVVDLNNTIIVDTVEEREKRIREEQESLRLIQAKKKISDKEIEDNNL